jgi:hypothetical protein
MKVVDITKILRKESAVYYKRYFTGVVKLELPAKTIEEPLEFTIETSPLSEKTITVTFANQLDYPLMPIIREVKTFILAKDNNGELPL